MTLARNGAVEIFYETFGYPSDPALVLINGLGSQCINYRTEWCEKFAAERFRVVRLDNRDVGLSTKFDNVQPDLGAVLAALAAGQGPDVPYTLSDMASDVVAVLDDLSIEKAHMVGVSMGGMILQTLAIEHPDRMLSMTSVMSTTGDPDVGQPTPEARRLLFEPPPADRAGHIARHLENLRAWGSPACYDEARSSAQAGEAYDRCFHPQGVGRQMMAIVASGSRTKALSGVTVPALVLHGDADRLVDPSGGRRTAEAIPRARLVMIEGMGHDYPPSYWDQLVGLVTDHARRATAA
jgi:pimeloyl-ACP methyl ester carboxylesterase